MTTIVTKRRSIGKKEGWIEGKRCKLGHMEEKQMEKVAKMLRENGLKEDEGKKKERREKWKIDAKKKS